MKTTDLSNIMCMAWRFYRTTRQAFGECLKLAWRNFNLVRKMHTEVVRFYFRKVDGTLREAWGTLRSDIVPPMVAIPARKTTPYKHISTPSAKSGDASNDRTLYFNLNNIILAKEQNSICTMCRSTAPLPLNL